jgi:hypothetical protein
MSLFHPPHWFPPQLAFLWPLVWVQVLMLRAEIRAAYGRGVKYHWALTPNLRVYLHSIDWIPGQAAGREGLKPRAHPSDRLAAACDGRAFMPEHLRVLFLLPREKGMRGEGDAARAGLAAAMLPLTPTPLPGERGLNLPPPDT